MPHVMLDLETLGTGNDAVILSIGAVKFDERAILDRFHVAIDPSSCQAHGLSIDARTVMWWLDEDREDARAQLLSHDRVDLATALEGYAMWFGPDSMPTWGNGSTFDNIILRSAYEACGLDYPTKFWDDSCYRSLKNRVPQIKINRVGIHHDALDDAESQARHLQAIAKHLGISL